MNIIYVCSESNPFIKTGGLGDVTFSLAKECSKQGHNLAIILPFYGEIASNTKYSFTEVCRFSQQLDWRNAETIIYKTVIENVDFYFVSNVRYFFRPTPYGEKDDDERFAFFSRASITAIQSLDLSPDIIIFFSFFFINLL